MKEQIKVDIVILKLYNNNLLQKIDERVVL